MEDQREANLSTLKGMFPDVDPEVCEAVFDANQADLEQSINALLGISDPNYKNEENIPVQTESGYLTSSTREQIERDEELARSLAAEADRQFYAENPQYNAQRQQQPQQQQQSSFPDFSEELPVIKEKISQAVDVTKKKAKEWYDKLKQQSAARNETAQHSTPHYTNLPGYEADNPVLSEDFSPLQQKNNDRQYISNTSAKTTSNTSNSRTSPLRSQPVYGSHGIDVNEDTNGDDVLSSSANHQIKIIRDDPNQSSINSDSIVSPYKLNDNTENLVNNNNSTSTTTSSTSDIHIATSADNLDAEETKKDLDLNNN